MSTPAPPPVDPIPEEYGSLIIQLIVADARAAIDFYKAAFDANELYRQYDAAGAKIVHCELLLGRSRLMLHDEFPDRDLAAPTRLGGAPVTLMLYVQDVDQSMTRAAKAGARIAVEPEDKFWGVRSGVLSDPFGYRWLLASRTEDLSPSEILERAKREPESARIPLGAPIRTGD